MPIRLVVADDHPLLLDALESLFRLEPDFAFAARCRDGDETLRAVRQHRPDVLVLDLNMPRTDGLAVLREIKRDGLPTRVVVLAAAITEDETLEALRLGARGIVLKQQPPELLIQCVRRVHGGGQWIDEGISGRALDALLQREAAAREIGGVLTPREVELVRLVAGGLRNKEIADRLAISQGTVKIHMSNIYRKLHIGSRVELALWARTKGFA